MDGEAGADDFRQVVVDGVAVAAWAGLPGDWVVDVVRSMAGADAPRRRHPGLPGGGRAYVKRYARRDSHGLLRRLRTGRAVHEGRGYRAFHRAGVPTPRLLLYGEARRRGLHEWGLVATERVEVPTVAQAWAQARDDGLLLAAARELAAIHNAGLSHGDAATRNFLATRPRPLPFDLASWGRGGHRRRTEDLTRLLGSVLVLDPDAGRVAGLLRHYAQWAAAPGPDEATLLDRAAAWAAHNARA